MGIYMTGHSVFRHTSLEVFINIFLLLRISKIYFNFQLDGFPDIPAHFGLRKKSFLYIISAITRVSYHTSANTDHSNLFIKSYQRGLFTDSIVMNFHIQ